MLKLIDRPVKPFWPARWWWIALGLVLLIAAIFRFTGYDFSLPYVDTPSEPNFALAGLSVLTRGSARAAAMHGYPPGLITIFYFLIRFFGSPDASPLIMIAPVRLITITLSVGAIALIALLAYRASTPLAGLVAAGLWAVAPAAIDFSRLARPDYYVVFFCLLALFLSVSGTLYDRDRLVGWGIVALLLGILFKYSAFAVTPAVLLPPLARLFGAAPETRKRVLANFRDNVLILAVFGFWLYALTPANEAENIPNYAGATSHMVMPEMATFATNLARAVGAAGIGLTWIPAIVGLALLFWPRFRSSVSPIGMGAVVLTAALWVAGVSLYGRQDFRQLILLAALLVILFGVGISLLAEGLAWLVTRVRLPGPRPDPRMSVGVVVALIAAMSIPQIATAAADAYNHTLPDRRVDLWTWGDVTLEPDTYYIGSATTEKIFNSSYGGYTGSNPFHRFENSKITRQTIEYWRENDVTYAILPYNEYLDLKASPNAADYLDQMVLLKSYPPSDQYRDPGLVVFSLYPMQHPLAAQLGPIKVLGYDLSSDEVRPGDTLTLRLYWRAQEPTSGDFKVFVHLLGDDPGQPVAQADALPLFDARRPTSSWDDPAEIIMSQPFIVTIGPDTPRGEYRLVTGFYREDTGERLTGPDGAASVEIITISVGP